MSSDANNDTDAQQKEDKEVFADAFDREIDPLAKYEEKFRAVDRDPFDMFLEDKFGGDSVAKSTRDRYDRIIRQWKAHTEGEGRHPACPNEDHVRGFIRWQRDDEGNEPPTIQRKVGVIKSIYDYWASHPSLPHDLDYHPVERAMERESYGTQAERDYPHIPLNTLRDHVSDITNIRNRAIVVLQLKTGMRAGEVVNLEVQDLAMNNSELNDHFSDLGTNPGLQGPNGYRNNAVYIPNDRDGNKSERPRVIPLDEEARRALLDWLLIRPDVDEPHIFLSTHRYLSLYHQDVTKLWKQTLGEHYPETEDHRAIRSHYGRHRFTTHFKIHKDWPEEQVQWMRGDKLGGSAWQNSDSIDHYLHVYYEEIESKFRDEIYKLRV